MPEIQVYLAPGAKLPHRGSPQAAGWDVHSCLPPDTILRLPPGERMLVPTGLYLQIPYGYVVSLRPRSGLAYKQGLILPNAPATIDADYRGELQVLLANIDLRQTSEIRHGLRIAQLLLEKVSDIQWREVPNRAGFTPTERQDGGFGSTGLA